MHKDFKKLKKNIAKQKLSPIEKTEMRSVLLSFMNDNPVAIENKPTRQMLLEGPFILNILRSKPMLATITIALILAISGGTSLAAEQSVPGDLLYPVKININENIRTAVSVSTEAKAKWETEKVERRLEEFERLKVENRLTADTSAQLQNSVTVQAEKIDRLTKKLEDNDKAAASQSRLEAVLQSHSQILVTLSDSQSDSKEESDSNKETVDVALDIAHKTQTAANNREKAEQKLSIESNTKVESSAKQKMKTAKNKIDEVKKFLNRKSAKVTAKTRTEAETTLGLANQAFIDGNTSLGAGLYPEAFVKFQEAIRLAQEAKIVASVSDKLKIDLKSENKKSDENKHSKSQDEDLNPESQTQNNGEIKTRSRIDTVIDRATEIRNRFRLNQDNEKNDNTGIGTGEDESSSLELKID